MGNFTNELKKKSVIITSYLDSELCFSAEIDSSDYIICIDGGYDIAVKNKIMPDLLMGDFDSMSSEMPENIEAIRFNPEKDYTDLELALKKSVELGFSDVLILGGIGGRLDHTMANIQLLSHYCSYFNTLIMKDGKNKCFVLNSNQKKGITIAGEPDSYISLFSLSEKCTGVTIKNVKYTLENHTLARDFPLGVSNEFAKNDAVLSMSDGVLLVIISKK